jgi:hypothetical protein
VQLELPPFSRFDPALIVLVGFIGAAVWGWSVFVLATKPGSVRRLPVWVWAILLVIVPFVAAPTFLLIGAPKASSRARRAIAISAIAAVVVTTGAVAIQQIGIVDCRIAPDRLTQVCEMEPRSTLLPVAIGVVAAIGIAAFILRPRRPSGRPEPLPT